MRFTPRGLQVPLRLIQIRSACVTAAGVPQQAHHQHESQHAHHQHEVVEEMTLVDVLVSMDSKEAALRAITRLTAANITASLEAHRVNLGAHIISAATLQHDFAAEPSFSLHPFPLFVESSILQSRARRRLRQAIYTTDLSDFRRIQKEEFHAQKLDSFVFDAGAKQLHARQEVMGLTGVSAGAVGALQLRPGDTENAKLKGLLQRHKGSIAAIGGLTAAVTRNSDSAWPNTFVSAADMEQRLYSPRSMRHMMLFEGDPSRLSYKEPTPRVAPPPPRLAERANGASEREMTVQCFNNDAADAGGGGDASTVSDHSRFDKDSLSPK